MIFTTVKHGRTRCDRRYLISHLTKVENAEVVLADIGKCVAETLDEFVAIAAIYRDAAPRANASTASFHHVTVNPSSDHPRKALLEMTHRVRLELDPSGTRPYAIVIHKKPRAEAGGSSEHAHLLISAADERAKFLDDGWLKLKTERLQLELAHDYGEVPVIGRHFKSALRHLRRMRPEVADWLEATVGIDPPKPESAFSPNARGRARGQGLNLPKAKAAVRAAWDQSDTAEAFRRKLTDVGFLLKRGNKDGVWIIEDSKGRLVGSANRLLKLSRVEFSQLMEMRNDPEFKRRISHERRGYGQADHRSAHRARSLSAGPASLDRVDVGKARRDTRSYRLASLLNRLDRRILVALIKAATAMRLHYERHLSDCEPALGDTLVRYDQWGIAQLPKPR